MYKEIYLQEVYLIKISFILRIYSIYRYSFKILLILLIIFFLIKEGIFKLNL